MQIKMFFIYQISKDYELIIPSGGKSMATQALSRFVEESKTAWLFQKATVYL